MGAVQLKLVVFLRERKLGAGQGDNWHIHSNWTRVGKVFRMTGVLQGSIWGENTMTALFRDFCFGEHGQDIVEYAVMLAVILVLVVGTIRLVGSNANNAFSAVASSVQ